MRSFSLPPPPRISFSISSVVKEILKVETTAGKLRDTRDKTTIEVFSLNIYYMVVITGKPRVCIDIHTCIHPYKDKSETRELTLRGNHKTTANYNIW